ncbi:trace amine-associated receptor 13c-like [Lepisosteus oculatus]|uniref:trace amine-associated receptor 13c-like n=1 Tax=Lepisosteus oculatus TaxID=7918 RepID=UPI0035F4FFA8
MDFRRHRPHTHSLLSIDGTEVETVTSFRFLGIHISNDLTWTVNTDSILKKTQQRLYFLRCLKRWGMAVPVSVNFYSYTESVLTNYVLRNTSSQERKVPQRMLNVAQMTIGCGLTEIKELYEDNCHGRIPSQRTVTTPGMSSSPHCFQEVRSTAVYVVMYISAVVVVMLTVCGNLVVIISISHFKQLHTTTNFLLLSLAVADLLVGIIVMPFKLIVLIETCWYFGDIFCKIFTTFSSVLTSVSVNNVACISIDRYFAVCYPFVYSAKLITNITWSIILLNWFLSLLYNLAFVYFNGNSSAELNTCLGDCLFVIDKIWGMVDLIFVFILPCSIMVALYLKIFVVASRHAKLINCVTAKNSPTNERKHNLTKTSEGKAAKTLGIIVIVFLLCLVPYYICTLVYEKVNISSSSVVINFLCWLMLFNSSFNPIIYALFYSWFQKSVKLIITLKIFNQSSSLINLFPETL